MRIFEIIESSPNASVPGSRTWERNLYEPLVEMGHDVILFKAEEGRQAMRRNDPQACAAFSQKLLEAYRREHAKQPFDLFFANLMDGMVEPAVIDEIRKTGMPTCNFSCNNTHQFYLVDELSPHFDYNLHSEKDAREKFLAIGANPLWWPMASNPKYFKPRHLPRDIAVSFVGANYALRARYIAHLLKNSVAVHVYGPGWSRRDAKTHWRSVGKHYKLLLKALLATSVEQQACFSAMLAGHDFNCSLSLCFPNNVHPSVSDDELIALYSRSNISLGFLEVYDRHDPSRVVTQHLHLREFEAPMSGALYLTGFFEELAEFFEPDAEVLVYRNEHELLEKVRYYLAHPQEAERVRQAGHKRALSCHTYQRRFQDLFTQIGLQG